MRRSELIRMLTLYTDSFLRTPSPAKRNGIEAWQYLPEMQPYVELIEMLQQSLQPVEMRAESRERLYASLLNEDEGAMTFLERSTPRMWLGAAALGSVLSLAGLFLWRRRQKDDSVIIPAAV